MSFSSKKDPSNMRPCFDSCPRSRDWLVRRRKKKRTIPTDHLVGHVLIGRMAMADFLLPLKGTDETLYYSKDEDVIEASVFTQSRQRFLMGCAAELLFAFVMVGCFVVGIACLATAEEEKDNKEWLQITTGVLLLILATPLSALMLSYLPHNFISALRVNSNEILLPRTIFLLRTTIPLSYFRSMRIDITHSVILEGEKSFWISGHTVGLSQLLWFIRSSNPSIKCDEYVLKRIAMWEKGDMETSTLL